MKRRTVALLVALAVVPGCGGGGDDDPATTAPPGADDTSSADDTMTTPPSDTSAPGVDTNVEEDAVVPPGDTTIPPGDTTVPPTDTMTPPPADTGGTTQPAVPRNPSALFAYLKAGTYKSFKHESAPHASTGPHGNVQVYINDILDRSLAAGGSGEHPDGAASVKELWSGSTLFGWAVMVKTAPNSNGGKNWYWFELFNTTDPSAALEGKGLPGCTGCHSLGRDYYRSPYPLK